MGFEPSTLDLLHGNYTGAIFTSSSTTSMFIGYAIKR